MPKNLDAKLIAAAETFIEDPKKNEIIKNNISKCYFPNEYFKCKLLQDTFNACKESRLFRELLVSLILKSKFPHTRNVTKIFSPYWNEDELIFLESKNSGSSSAGNFISFSYHLNKVYLKTSFFNSRYTAKEMEKGVYAIISNNDQILFHEMAHSWIADFFYCTTKSGIDSTIELFSKIITEVNFYKDAFNKFYAHLHTLPKTIQEKYIKHYNDSHSTKFTTLNELKAYTIEKTKSQNGIIEVLFDETAEIIQIMGLASVKYGDRNILFINSLSDFALSAKLGRPIKRDHEGYTINPKNEDAIYTLFPEKLCFDYNMNLEFYGLMLKIYGSSMQEYTLKLMYGDSLFSALKIEWKLWSKYSKRPSNAIIPYVHNQNWTFFERLIIFMVKNQIK